MTSVLGGKVAGAFNVPALVRASGGGQCPCARRLLIRSSLFSYSTVAGGRALIDSLDALSVFEARAIEDRTYDWVERRVGDLDLRSGILVTHVSLGTLY